MFVAVTEEPLETEEQDTLNRWLQTETGLERVEILRKEAPDTIDAGTQTTEE